ncbi:hypothetical protein SELMODRAFT_424463 [Selaginella moellendorffii]|uniref:Fido domain-containing protein n=1 Tax=Selaginella moellendorffii TaxID=88036 RepID=D8SPZ0_SELML|nr:hypothetical protein SELMODRAFT_424463 [Selaginella moellendorffii]
MRLRPLELPWWRALTMQPEKQRSTSDMVKDIAAAATTAASSRIPQRLIPHPDSALSNRACLEYNFPDYLSDQQRAESQGMCDALEYALHSVKPGFALDLHSLADIQARVVNGGAGLGAGVSAEVVASKLGEIKSGVASLLELPVEERVVPAFGVAACGFLDVGSKLRPFGDGNSRLAEVVASLVLDATGVVPFPLRVHCIAGGESYTPFPPVSDKLRKSCTPEELMTYVIERAWLAWASRHEFEDILQSFRNGPPLSSRSRYYE